MKAKTEILFKAMKYIAWIIFIGLMIVAGSIIISYIVSIGNENAAKDLYKGMNLYAYRQLGLGNYSFLTGYKVIFYLLQAYVAFLIIKLFKFLDLSKPFNSNAVKVLQKLSFYILAVWITILIQNVHLYILERIYEITAIYSSNDAIFLAGIVFLLSQIFKRGLEIQSENELYI